MSISLPNVTGRTTLKTLQEIEITNNRNYTVSLHEHIPPSQVLKAGELKTPREVSPGRELCVNEDEESSFPLEFGL